MILNQQYALFDFDGTIIRGDSIIRLLPYAYKQRMISFPALLKSVCGGIGFKLGLLSRERSKEIALSFLQGRSVQEVERFGSGFCRDVLLGLIRPEAQKTLHDLHAKKYMILLISASCSFYLKPLMEYLPVDAVLGTEFSYDSQMLFSGKIDGRNCSGIEKISRLDRYLLSRGLQFHPENSIACGDSASDHPMMLRCARRIGVNPKRKLRKLLRNDPCAEILHWNEPEA